MAQDALNELLGRAAVLTARKKVLMEESRLLTSGQSALLVPEKADELLALVEKKQGYMEEVNRIDAAVLLLEEEIINAAGISSREELKKIFNDKWEVIENLRSEIIFILQEAQRVDEQNRQKIDKEYRKLKEDMESLCARRGTVKAYQGSAVQSGSYFIDQKK